MNLQLKIWGILGILVMLSPIGCNDVSLPEQAKTKPAECAKESNLTNNKKKFKSVRLALTDGEESETDSESEKENKDEEADKEKDSESEKEKKDDEEDKDSEKDKDKKKEKDCAELTDGESKSNSAGKTRNAKKKHAEGIEFCAEEGYPFDPLSGSSAKKSVDEVCFTEADLADEDDYECNWQSVIDAFVALTKDENSAKGISVTLSDFNESGWKIFQCAQSKGKPVVFIYLYDREIQDFNYQLLKF